MKSTPSGGTARSGRDVEIEAVARQLRAALRPVLRAAVGGDPRPMQLARAIDVDKSLASVLVRALNAPTDRELLHVIPSPTGLRILIERTKDLATPTAHARLAAATERFRRLLESTPGGRAALDANIAETSRELGTKRENTSRQAAFKAMSFLLGYYGELMASSILLIPSETDGMVDGIEITRRLGVRRMRSSATIPLFNFIPWPDDGPPGTQSRFDPVTPDPRGPAPENLLLPAYCTDPMPPVEVAHEGTSTAVVLPGTRSVEGAMDFAWAFRLRNGGPRELDPGMHPLHGYFLHMPTRRVTRDVYLAEEIYPGATPAVSWALPGTRQYEHPPDSDQAPYYASVDLAAGFEPITGSARPFGVRGMPGHDRLTREILERVGHGKTRFRGWRCTLEYPVPLLEMFVWLDHPGQRPARS